MRTHICSTRHTYIAEYLRVRRSSMSIYICRPYADTHLSYETHTYIAEYLRVRRSGANRQVLVHKSGDQCAIYICPHTRYMCPRTPDTSGAGAAVWLLCALYAAI